MEYLQGIYRISHVGTGSMCDFTIECPQLAQRSKAGQFVHIRLPGFTLRRPISICEVEGDSLRILFDVRGEGTRVMAQLREGDSIDVMGPLGNGFTLLDSQKKAVVVGGGIGVPPMLQTAKHYAGNATAILGFRDAGKIVLTQDFEKYGARVMLATDDGSAGHHGLVTDLLRQRLEEEKQMCAQYGVRCEVSLEERMACGVGACLGCATPIRREDGSVTYLHVCKDGPVFDAERVVFDE